MPKAAGHVKILIFLVKIKLFPIYANNFCDAGQVPISRYFEACITVCILCTMPVPDPWGAWGAQPAFTIRNGSKTTPGFNMRRADGNFRLWW